MYHHHTGYIGNLKSTTLEKQLQKAPERVIETAVRGMMPKNKLGRAMFKKLRVYAGNEHQHTAQQPIALDI
jgi:large subunit ribosomal protein L13